MPFKNRSALKSKPNFCYWVDTPFNNNGKKYTEENYYQISKNCGLSDEEINTIKSQHNLNEKLTELANKNYSNRASTVYYPNYNWSISDSKSNSESNSDSILSSSY